MARPLVLTYVGVIQNLHYPYFPEQLESKTEGSGLLPLLSSAPPTEALLGSFLQEEDGQGQETAQLSAPPMPGPEG